MIKDSAFSGSRGERFPCFEGLSSAAWRDGGGEPPFAAVEAELGEVMHEAAELLSHWAKAKGISYGVEITPGLARWVVADRTLLLWSLACLMGNGVQRTERGEVVLSVSPGVYGGWLRFHVRDSGSGLSPESLGALFAAADGEVDECSPEGADQLALCKRLVGRMGGFIRGESRTGAGSTFTAEIPAQGVSFEKYAL